MENWRFILDSIRSPICSITARMALIIMKKIVLPGANMKELRKPITQAAMMPQIRPEMVLLGLILGASLGPLKFLPPK